MTVAPDVAGIQHCEDEQGDSDEEWPECDEEVGQGSVDEGRVASYILEDIEPVSLNDNSCKSHNVSTTRDAHRWFQEIRCTHKESCTR